ncbi:MAG TPA: hypothetical protein VF511_08645, partial [Chthoniobacterales bacterium]
AIVAALPPGGYTAILFGNRDTIGRGLVEIYDLSPASGRLGNIATRGSVATGDDVMIAGFIITGPEHKRITIRGLGPSLRSTVPGALPDTSLDLLNANGMLVASATGSVNHGDPLDPTDPKDTILTTDIVPGNYTAILQSPSRATGIGLIEVYDGD